MSEIDELKQRVSEKNEMLARHRGRITELETQVGRLREALLAMREYYLEHTIAARVYEQVEEALARQPDPLMDCPKCGEFRGHGHECKPEEGAK